jgi:hypothetical protein
MNWRLASLGAATPSTHPAQSGHSLDEHVSLAALSSLTYQHDLRRRGETNVNILDRLLGDQSEPRNDRRASGPLTDEQAVDRYRYLLRTAPPEAIEVAHAEAFAQLTPEQRSLVLAGLSENLPPRERRDRDDPQSLARLATRAELRRPGTLERTFSGMQPGGTGIGLGGLLAADFLSTIAGVVVGSAIADAIFNDGGYDQGYQDGAESADADYAGGDAGYDAAGDLSGDFAGGDF